MKKIVLATMFVIALSLVFAGAALAATPQDIFNDWLDNGRLDGTYTDDELRSYLNDATMHQYGDPQIVDLLDRNVSELLTGEELTREAFPFTGAQIALIAIGVIALLGGGVALRRFANSRS